jgi:hypothetical protein
VAALLTMGLVFFAFIGMANYVVYQYGRGAVRSAVDQAAQAGSRASASTETCEARAAEALDSLAGGSLGDDITVSCSDNGQYVTATATATFQGWLDVIPDYTFTVDAVATTEHAP